jgi:hypothetical protein
MKVSTLPAKSLALSDAAMAEMWGRVEAAPTTANSWCGFAVAAASVAGFMPLPTVMINPRGWAARPGPHSPPSPAPTLGTTPAEDTTAAAGHLATSSVAVADTSVSTDSNSSGGAATGSRGDPCDIGAGSNDKGNIVYLPLHEQAGECVATGASTSLDQSDYTPPLRPRLGFALPGFQSLPVDNRSRGHLIGFAFGGSNTDLRNFVAMYQKENQRMFTYAESPVLKAIQQGGHESVEVMPVYGDPTSPGPTQVNFTAQGTTDVSCTFNNDSTGTYRYR